jgi:apolipoprotein N-acyltransferase
VEEVPDLIVWPETAFPRLLNSDLMRLNPGAIPKIIIDVIEGTGAELFTGGYDSAGPHRANFFETEYNAAFHFSDRVKLLGTYHKRLLIPFGESLPFGPFNPWLAKFISNISFFAKGNHYSEFHSRNSSRFTTAICYEILFSSFIRDYMNSLERPPHFLMNLTNDSWYGDTSEPYQHKFLAHWRALEFQLPIVRMTNTGISSILYPDGSESSQLGIGASGALTLSVPLIERQPSLFERFGIWLTFGLALVLASFFELGATIWRKRD